MFKNIRLRGFLLFFSFCVLLLSFQCVSNFFYLESFPFQGDYAFFNEELYYLSEGRWFYNNLVTRLDVYTALPDSPSTLADHASFLHPVFLLPVVALFDTPITLFCFYSFIYVVVTLFFLLVSSEKSTNGRHGSFLFLIVAFLFVFNPFNRMDHGGLGGVNKGYPEVLAMPMVVLLTYLFLRRDTRLACSFFIFMTIIGLALIKENMFFVAVSFAILFFLYGNRLLGVLAISIVLSIFIYDLFFLPRLLGVSSHAIKIFEASWGFEMSEKQWKLRIIHLFIFLSVAGCFLFYVIFSADSFKKWLGGILILNIFIYMFAYCLRSSIQMTTVPLALILALVVVFGQELIEIVSLNNNAIKKLIFASLCVFWLVLPSYGFGRVIVGFDVNVKNLIFETLDIERGIPRDVPVSTSVEEMAGLFSFRESRLNSANGRCVVSYVVFTPDAFWRSRLHNSNMKVAHEKITNSPEGFPESFYLEKKSDNYEVYLSRDMKKCDQ